MAVDSFARKLAGAKVPVDAYEMAVAGGYTGTREQFQTDMGDSATNAANAANSAAEAAGYAELLGPDVLRLKRSVENFNAFDIWDGLLTRNNGTSYKVVYTWDGDTCTVTTPNGASSSYSANIVLYSAALPSSVVPGRTYYVHYHTTDTRVSLRIIFKDSEGTNITPIQYCTKDTSVTVPSNAAQWTAALYVTTGISFETPVTVSDIHFVSAPTNRAFGSYDVKRYGAADLDAGKFYNLHITSQKQTLDPIADHESNASYSSILIPVKKGDTVTLRTTGGTINAKPYGIIKQNYLIDSVYTDSQSFYGIIDIVQTGYLAVNLLNTYSEEFFCEIKTELIDDVRESTVLNALPVRTDLQRFPRYDPDDVCRVLKTDTSLGSMLHHWAVVGASFDSGEFNFRVNNNEHMSEIDWFAYSCWEEFIRMNGIPDLYNYSNGGQNAKDWVALKSGDHFLGVTSTELAEGSSVTTITVNGASVAAVDYGLAIYQNQQFLFTVSDGRWHAIDTVTRNWISWYGCISRSYAFNSDTEEVLWYWDHANGVVGRSGIGPGGGCWWKMRQDFERGRVKQVFVINLGSNDINNNYPHNDDWSVKETYDADLYYTCGTTDDIGTYDLETDSDTVPAGKTEGVVPGIVNSYAAYIGAILNRILAIQPDAVIFLCTIRNGFSNNTNRMAVWTEYNDTLKAIAEMDRYKNNVYILDNGEFGPNYSVSPMKDFLVGYHPNALGYKYLALYWNTLIDYAIQTHYKRFEQSMFIGTGKQYSSYVQ